MAIRILQDDKGNKNYTVYINGFDQKGTRIQKTKKGIKSLQNAKDIEFELKRQLYNQPFFL